MKRSQKQSQQCRARPIRILPAALLLGVCCWAAGCSEPPPALVAYVASAGNNHVQVIDLEAGETLRKIYAGATPWRLELSPDRSQLWVQHWYSATTAVIDLTDHEIVRTLPYRGPGLFTPRGDRFLTFSWPTSALYQVDARTFEQVSEQYTEVPRVYDLALDAEQGELYLVQADPMAGRAHRIYSYILSYPYTVEDPAQAAPLSLRTGYGPFDVRRLTTQPFLLTADSDTNGLSLINANRDGRAVPTCPAPRAILVSPDETRMIVACWRGNGYPTSQLAAYQADFSARPWPELAQEPFVTLDGALTAGAFSPAGDRIYLADRTGGRLLEMDARTFEMLRVFPTGDEPVAVVVTELPAPARDRLRQGEGRGRRLALEALTRLGASGRPFTDLSWTETAVWFEVDPGAGPGEEGEDGEGSENEAEAAEQAEEAEPAAETPAEEPVRIERRRTLHHALRGPGWLRTEAEDGGLRLAQGGQSVSVDPDGRFWITPRQELISFVYALPNLSPEEALRHLAGDIPGSPFLHGGIAVDIAEEVTVDGRRHWVLGAPGEGARTSQLWIDAESGRPVNLVEQIPVFRARSHDEEDFSGIVETRFLGFSEWGDGVVLPTELERLVDGQWSMDVTLENVKLDQGLPDELFSLARLGGRQPRGLIEPVPGEPSSDGPGLAVPELPVLDVESYLSPHPPYNSNPPTSGARLYDLARWGAHDSPIPLPLQVRNLEEGGVAVQFNCPEPCPDLMARLEEMLHGREGVLLAPYPWMDARIALTARGRIETLEEPDEARIHAFLDAYAGRSREPAAGEE